MPWRVCLSGLPGGGKSMIARALAAETGALWLRVDRVEQAKREPHMKTEDLADGGYAAPRAVPPAVLEQGSDVIADRVNPIPLTQEAWRAAMLEEGGRHLDVALTCSNTKEHRRRVETCKAEVPKPGLPDWQAVLTRTYEPLTAADLSLDAAARPVEAGSVGIRTALQEYAHG
ncbi:AAA family ATPase [Dinoroseobacter sp. S76]|uniref:AAA family ATPase n=1 Tax=Dinoroseobacter sp. S76 TaxID=3415124 RepID=UPI003C7C062B